MIIMLFITMLRYFFSGAFSRAKIPKDTPPGRGAQTPKARGKQKLTYLLIGLVVSAMFDDTGQGARGQAVDLVESISDSSQYTYTGGSDQTRTTSQPTSKAFDGVLVYGDDDASCSKTTKPAQDDLLG